MLSIKELDNFINGHVVILQCSFPWRRGRGPCAPCRYGGGRNGKQIRSCLVYRNGLFYSFNDGRRGARCHGKLTVPIITWKTV